MARLEGLEQAYRAGSMTPDQQARYRVVLHRLQEHMLLISRLGLLPQAMLSDAGQVQ